MFGVSHLAPELQSVKSKFRHSYIRKTICTYGCCSLLLLWSRSFCNIGEFQDPSAAHLIFVVIAASGTEWHCW